MALINMDPPRRPRPHTCSIDPSYNTLQTRAAQDQPALMSSIRIIDTESVTPNLLFDSSLIYDLPDIDFSPLAGLYSWYRPQCLFLPAPRKLCNTRSLFVCLSVCLSVSLLATLRKNYWTHIHENFTTDVSVHRKELIKFQKSSASRSGSRNFFWRILQHCEIGHFFHNLAHVSG